MLDASLDVATDDDVTFSFTARNAGDDPVDLTFRSAKAADVGVYERRSGGEAGDADEVWRWSEGRLFAQAMRTVTLDPGEEQVFEFAWEDPDPGDYEAVATLEADVDATARTEFSVD